MKRVFLTVFAALVFAGNALSSGMLIPKDKSLPPLAVKHQRVDIRVKDGVATAKIEQVFKNSVNRDLEAVYVFPLPQNAAIGDFAMYINGKRMSGELVEKDKARKIYQDIVRRLKDPGLLEYLGGNLFRISIYPVPKNGEQRIELEYSQQLDFDSGLYKFVYPLKTGERASRTLDDFTVSVNLKSSVPIKNVYSPSHEVGISRKGENEAVIGFEEDQALLDRDFVLYYGVSQKDFGLNLLTHAVKGQDGYYMMMLSPSVTPPGGKPMAKDVVFVFDTSGSMKGKKITQAREAFEYCVKHLNDGDRFNLVRFSTDIETLGPKLLDANDANRKKALNLLAEIEARGGTAIDGALSEALGMDFDAKRPSIIVFLTDGKPTVGESDTDIIVKNVAGRKKGRVRLFVFGVGEKVNTHLLDRLSGDHGGVSQYVKPGEHIEAKVSSLADKLSNPVLSNLELVVDKLKTRKVHPRELSDLFSGDQLVVLGRYDGDGHVAIRLLGDVEGKKREFVYEGDFAKVNGDNDFIPRLWATRRVGYLLDQIRLQGEEHELKDEVILLSREYGIMTPYTSYLVLENDDAYKQHGIARGRNTGVVPLEAEEAKASHVFAGKGLRRTRADRQARVMDEAAGDPRAPMAPAPEPVPLFSRDAVDGFSAPSGAMRAGREKRYQVVRENAGEVSNYLKRDSGREAIQLSEAIRKYRERSTDREDIASVRHVGKKIFYLLNGQWVDSAYNEKMKTRRVAFASDEYFELLRKRPELKPFLALGEKMIVALDDGSALIVE
jgi:Ca-activated chloride channel homolog